jgi:hypothetical protein
MRNSLFIFKPPNQREDIIDKCRECDKDRNTASTRPNSVFVTQKGCRSEFQDPPIKSFTSKTMVSSVRSLINKNCSSLIVLISNTFKAF